MSKKRKENGRDTAETLHASSASHREDAENSSNGCQHIDRQTSQLTRRILPKGIDGRSREAKRLVGLVQDFAKFVDNPDHPIVRARLVAAALLTMQQESLAHQVAAGHAVDPDDVVRIHHATERALERLGAS